MPLYKGLGIRSPEQLEAAVADTPGPSDEPMEVPPAAPAPASSPSSIVVLVLLGGPPFSS